MGKELLVVTNPHFQLFQPLLVHFLGFYSFTSIPITQNVSNVYKIPAAYITHNATPPLALNFGNEPGGASLQQT